MNVGVLRGGLETKRWLTKRYGYHSSFPFGEIRDAPTCFLIHIPELLFSILFKVPLC